MVSLKKFVINGLSYAFLGQEVLLWDVGLGGGMWVFGCVGVVCFKA